ncbi:MAG: Calcineurin-like phosphoesterase [Firmicutes bacterium ADurb.Bin193]|nr:MAG: Calcineurin-like phosphoesterase [Firmicutes bacterium ADurb.Bin193]
MALFAISDLHLSLGADKPMDIFGGGWENHEQKLKECWTQVVTPSDVVIVNGDISWATYLENAKEDFAFINSLPGQKIISKGNHDYWWSTVSKQKKFCSENGFDTIDFLHNNYFMYEDTAICGTKGWQLSTNDSEDMKLYNREKERLELSLRSALKSNPKRIVVALHYPPDGEFISILKKNGVQICVYGHLHGRAQKNAVNGTTKGIKFSLVSCDFLKFNPLKIL